MKRTLLLFSTFIVATIGFEDSIEQVATQLNLTREQMETCLIKANVTIKDIISLINKDENFTAEGTKESTKIGCLVTCLMQQSGVMTGTHINIQQMEEIVRSKQDKIEPHDFSLIQTFLQMFDTCNNLVRDITNECEVGLQFLLCFINEIKRS